MGVLLRLGVLGGGGLHLVVQRVKDQGDADKVIRWVLSEVVLEFADGGVHLHQ
jgi:hypothetical protein